MTVSIKKPKLDFESMLGDPDEQKPRTLREIADEVGFPFTARAVQRGNPGTSFSAAGVELSVLGPGKILPESAFDVRVNGKRMTIGSYRPRWILLGHK